MSQRYDLRFQLQLSSCRLNIEKIDFSIVIKFFCDVINVEVLYFQITFKFDIFRFFLSPKLQHLETSFFQQKIEKNIRKKMMKKNFFDQKSRSSIFSNHGRFKQKILGLKFAYKLVLSLYNLIQMTNCFSRSDYVIKTSQRCHFVIINFY